MLQTFGVLVPTLWSMFLIELILWSIFLIDLLFFLIDLIFFPIDLRL